MFNASEYRFSARPATGALIFPDGEEHNFALGQAWPGGPDLSSYGIDLTRLEQTPSISGGPIPAPPAAPSPPPTDVTIGAPGTPIFSGFLRDLGEYNPKLEGRSAFPIYEKMRRSDADVRAGLVACKLPVRAAEKQIIPGVGPNEPDHGRAKEIADFVRENLFGGLEQQTPTGAWQTQAFETVEENALLSLDFGCAAHEDIWSIDGDNVRLRRMAPRLPSTFYRWWVADDGDTLLALEQYGYRKNEYVNVIVPAEKICVFNHQKEGANFFGMALALDTPILTLDGWKNMNDLQVGDTIFDDQGQLTKVVAKSVVWKKRPCYRVIFGDGTSVVADANHLWLTQTFHERHTRRQGSVRTTKSLVESLTYSYGNGMTCSNHSIPRCAPLQYLRQDLPINPYILGAWLGDGSHDGSRVACHRNDEEHLISMAEGAGYATDSSHSGRVGSLGRSVTLHGLVTQVKGLGLYKNKYIPEVYLRGDVIQRKALLAGLMDTDGSVNSEGQCSFCNSNRKLIDAVVELLRSLGEAPTVVEMTIGGERKNLAWEVRFFPMETPFSLERKTEALNAANAVKKFRRHRTMIVAVERVEDQDTVCIEVDSPSHLFLCGGGLQVTHNSILRSAYLHWFMKSNLYRIDAIALERNAQGVPTFKLPTGYATEDKKAAVDWARQLVTHEQTGLVLPPGWEFEINGIKGRLRDPWQSIRHHSEEIVRSMLEMFMALGTTQSGSRALGNTFVDFFFLSLEATARHIADTITNGTIRRLVDYNFDAKKGKPLPYPKLVYSSIVVLDPIEVASAVKDLANAQTDIFQPDDELENYLRRKFSLPLKTKLRPRFLPVQTRLMESPIADETISEIESESPTGGKVQPENAGKGVGALVSQGTKAGVKNTTTGKPPGAIPGLEPAQRTPKPKAAKVQASEIGGDTTITMVDGLAIGGTVYELLLSEGNGRLIALDFDGVLAEHDPDYTKVGAPIPAGLRLAQDLVAKGFRLLIFTARVNRKPVKEFLQANGIEYVKVTNIKDPLVVAWIDDRAISVDSKKPKTYRKVTKKIRKLEKRGI